jgi:hypothetical protein
MTLQGHQCIYPVGHSGSHYAPTDGLDHSDDIRIKVLSDALAEAEARHRALVEQHALDVAIVRRETALRCASIARERGDCHGTLVAENIVKEFG